MGTYIEPFDFWNILVGYFLGNQALFPFASTILISLLCAYFSLPDKVFVIILIISSAMFGAYIGEAYYFLVLMITGFIIYKVFSHIFN